MSAEAAVHVVDDDAAVRDSLRWLLESVGLSVNLYDSAQAFMAKSPDLMCGCVLLDVRLRDMSGLQLQRVLRDNGFWLPILFITGHGDVEMAVQAMKEGAADFFTKPLDEQRLLDSVQSALAQSRHQQEQRLQQMLASQRLTLLTPRERQVLERVSAGQLNKVIADDLHISIKTVEVHRGRIMEKMQAGTLAELLRRIALTNTPD